MSRTNRIVLTEEEFVMVMSRRLGAFVIVLTVCVLAAPGFGCVIIVPPERPIPHRPPPPRTLPMEVRSHRARIEIRGQVATTHVEAVFHNPNSRRIEGTYLFPIAPDAAVSSFAMTVNGKTMEAELLPAGKARKIYEDIVRTMRDPALLEYLEEGVLKARVFPIEPHKDVKVELSYDQRVRRDGSLARVRYPLLSARPQADNRLQSLVVEVSIEARGEIKTVFVPGFDAKIVRDGDHRARVTFEASTYRPDRDFEVVFSEQTGRVGVEMLTYRKGDDGYFMLMIAPASELQQDEIQRKHIQFVVDTSGSMRGEKMRQAQQALRYCINGLSESDHFGIIAFSTDVVPFREGSVPASAENRREGLRFVDGLKARGGTAIDDALALAMKVPDVAGAVPIIVFLTDGLPTIGEVDPEKIIANVGKRSGKQRVFSFGVGYDVNTKLLDSVAGSSRGYTTYVPPEEDLELALSDFYEKVASPVMTDLKLDAGTVRLTAMTPEPLPDLFKGGQITVLGRYDGKGKTTVTVSGAVGGARERYRAEADLDGDPRSGFIPRMWAVSRVGQLMKQIRVNGESGELVEEVKRLGRAHGIVTPYTSFLVVEEGLEVDARRRAREELEGLMDSATEVSGQHAVKAARADRDMAAAPSAAEPGVRGFYADELRRKLAGEGAGIADGSGGGAAGEAADDLRRFVRHAADKTFYYRASDRFFYDSAIPAGETPKADIEVTLWSEAFFRLLREVPALRRYLDIGERLVVRIDDTVIRISD